MKARFDDCLLDSDTRRLLREGREIHLPPKAFDLLCLLVERRPSVVPKDELLTRIWPKTIVVEANLNVLVGDIRRALGDDAQSPRYVRTAHGVGYAFCGDAVIVNGSGPTEEAKARFWLVWKNRTFLLAAGDNTIGRDPSCSVWLDHAGVSRRHARIQIDLTTMTAMVDDLESTNGTFVGTQRVASQTALGDGDIIALGSVQLKFRAWSEGAARTKRIRHREG